MGYYSELDAMGRRYYENYKYVCAECLIHDELSDYIESNGDSGSCDYCHEEKIVFPLPLLLDFIFNCIYFYWDQPENSGVPYETAEGGWQLGVQDGFDFFYDVVACDFSCEELEKDLREPFLDLQFTLNDPFSGTRSEELQFSWEQFCKIIKHQTRYVFFYDNEHEETLGVYSPSSILDQIGVCCSEVGLITRLERGERFIRGRIHNSEESINTVSQLGPPPLRYAKYSNRMSPAGIPMFYAALEQDTALAELAPEYDRNSIFTYGEFELIRDILVLDLTNIPRVPNIFDTSRNTQMEDIIFLHSLEDAITQSVIKDGREHIEYVPTQVFTEFFRRKYKYADENIDGIIYNSSRNSGGKCIVLFIEGKNVIDAECEITSDSMLKLSRENIFSRVL
ncbi:HEPN-associated N-terminal domain-containing protein [Fusibacter sp. JL216-2]|uniref:HEPN-associated N-terminal domain-containing protein n=1 Tax=Fusibacter sp. JL216-2 TaxID=3071453 RepID=UPI003D35769D